MRVLAAWQINALAALPCGDAHRFGEGWRTFELQRATTG